LVNQAYLTPADVMVKRYAIIGWALENAFIMDTPRFSVVPPRKATYGSIRHTDCRDEAAP
jgi:hypothetical protein